jgi:hypothetical protein
VFERISEINNQSDDQPDHETDPVFQTDLGHKIQAHQYPGNRNEGEVFHKGKNGQA